MTNSKRISILSEESRSLLARIFVWGALLGILWLLNSFFLLIFLTFIFSFLQTKGAARLEPYIPQRPLRVVVAALFLLSMIVATGFFIVPKVREQTISFAERLPEYIAVLDRNILQLELDYPIIADVLPGLDGPENSTVRRTSPSTYLFQAIFGSTGVETTQGNIKVVVGVVRELGSRLIAVGSAFFLSLLFSFLIVLDLPKLQAGAQGLRNTKLRFIYEEVADGLCSFARMMGRAFEAQFYIALLNAGLTAIGIMILGIGDKVAFLSVIVFLCSFIPVAGVFISSLPICLIALQESGFGLIFAAIALIIIIHMIEAYILNPRIYGHHLHLNPVLVLIILTVGGKLFGVWGLILGVPICTYIFSYAIREREDRAAL